MSNLDERARQLTDSLLARFHPAMSDVNPKAMSAAIAAALEDVAREAARVAQFNSWRGTEIGNEVLANFGLTGEEERDGGT